MNSPILLIGYRGTGKTTVARLLAGTLGYEFVDADDEIEARARKSIAQIFAESGEAGFRDIESEVLADLCCRERTVLALGGGAILRAENRLAIQRAGPVVWLTASPEAILRRVAADKTTNSRRPNLTTGGGLGEIEQLLEARLPFYRECATLEVATEGKMPSEIAEEIAGHLRP